LLALTLWPFVGSTIANLAGAGLLSALDLPLDCFIPTEPCGTGGRLTVCAGSTFIRSAPGAGVSENEISPSGPTWRKTSAPAVAHAASTNMAISRFIVMTLAQGPVGDKRTNRLPLHLAQASRSYQFFEPARLLGSILRGVLNRILPCSPIQASVSQVIQTIYGQPRIEGDSEE